MITVKQVQIVPRTSNAGHPFADVFIDTEDGRRFYSRLFHPLDDTPFARAEQAEQFKRRYARGETHGTRAKVLAI